jgi:2-phospho-L-lactate guanylyltransferase
MLALVPVKRFALAKQRLRPVLNDRERGALSLAMSCDVIASLRQSPCIERVLVCAGDTRLLPVARSLGADVILESDLGLTGLNKVVNALASDLYAEGASRLLVCHSDIPGLLPGDVDQIANQLDQADVVICPDGLDQGSNLLAWRLACGFSPRYGSQSFQRHRQQADKRGLTLSVCRPKSAFLDLDRPADLWTFLQAGALFQHTRTYALLQQFGLDKKLATLAEGEDKKGVLSNVTL